MRHGHDHDHDHQPIAAGRRAHRIAIALNLGFVAREAAAGFWFG